MKLDITGASNFVNRMFEACGPYQWAREFLKNAEEAGAKRIDFGIEWQAVQKLGVYRRTVADDGAGMDAAELVRFFSKLGDGAKPIGGVHDNFGVGAKIASLPWNPLGVVVLSWKNGEASMIWIKLNPDTGDYYLLDYNINGELTAVIDPTEIEWEDDEVNWGLVKPDFIDQQGTVVVLLGSQDHEDTFLGNPELKEGDLKGLRLYLNSRFWDLRHMDVGVTEFHSQDRQTWPRSQDDQTGTKMQRSKAPGAYYYIKDVQGKDIGAIASKGDLSIDEDRVDVEWYLWTGARPDISPYARRGGYVAVRYKGELFNLSPGKVQFRWFGIIETPVRHRTTIILEPRQLGQGGGKWGVHPDQSRNRLIFSGGGAKGIDVPLSDWGLMFAELMPDEIRKAILENRSEQAGDLQDEEYRKRLQDKFGQRWKTPRLVVTASPQDALVPASASDDEEEDDVVLETSGDLHAHSSRPRPKTDDRILKVKSKLAVDGGDEYGKEKDTPVDVPRYQYRPAEDFLEKWHLAAYVPSDPEGPTVYLNSQSGILRDLIEYHQEQYPEVHHEEVANIILHVIGEVAVSKVAHSEKLKSKVPIQQLNEVYRSEAALTVALMGLIAEESLISQRLGRLGKKKS